MRHESKGSASVWRGSAVLSMGAVVAAGLACLAPGAVGMARAAEEAPDGLSLSAGEVRTDASGAFITVNVKNASQNTYGEIVVSCAFYGGGSALGSSTTTLFATVPGVTGSDQVRLMGATSATSAKCRIASAK